MMLAVYTKGQSKFGFLTIVQLRQARASSSGTMATPSPNRREIPTCAAGRKMPLLGFAEAASEPAAIATAVAGFGLNDERRKRMAVNLRR